MDIACGRALKFGAYGYKVIKSICEKGIKDIEIAEGLYQQEKPIFGQYQRSLEEYEELLWKKDLTNN